MKMGLTFVHCTPVMFGRHFCLKKKIKIYFNFTNKRGGTSPNVWVKMPKQIGFLKGWALLNFLSFFLFFIFFLSYIIFKTLCAPLALARKNRFVHNFIKWYISKKMNTVGAYTCTYYSPIAYTAGLLYSFVFNHILKFAC